MNAVFPLADFAPSGTYLLGISGGRDSVALLEALLAGGYRGLVLCHLNHQLRGEASDGDAAFVENLGRQHGLAVEIEAEDVAARARRERLSIEAAARAARLAFFARCAERRGTSTLFLAHHADDQAETVLINLIRGTGPRGLAGMERVCKLGPLTVVRPFLAIRRDALPVPAACREDASNDSDDFLRNRIRRRVLPAIQDAAGRDAVPAMLRLAAILREDERTLDALALAALEGMRDAGGTLEVPVLRTCEPAIQRRLLLRWLRDSGIAGCGFREVEAIRDLLPAGAATAKVNLPGGAFCRRREKRLFLQGASAEAAKGKESGSASRGETWG